MNNTIRVIVPTMWNYPKFWDFAKYILKLDVVTEFVIINNAPELTPDLELLTDPKVKVISFGKNIYVNPAWNCGTWGCKTDVICVINDDFIFDIRVFYKASEFITNEMGCIGLSEQVVEDGKVPLKQGHIEFTPYTGQSRWGCGVLFFMPTKNWIDIPSDLLVCFGDDFIFDQCYYRGLINHTIDDLFHYHAGAQTTRRITDDGKKDDMFINKEHVIYTTTILPQLQRGIFKFN